MSLLAQRSFVALLLGTFLLALVGCVSPLRLTFVPDETVAGRTVDVDVVGVNRSDLQMWRDYTVSEYFKAGNDFRAAARASGRLKTIVFRSGGPSSETIESKDPIWKKWSEAGVTHLVVIANLPGDIKDTPGEGPARKILPWDDGWPSNAINLTVSKGMVSVNTPHKD